MKVILKNTLKALLAFPETGSLVCNMQFIRYFLLRQTGIPSGISDTISDFIFIDHVMLPPCTLILKNYLKHIHRVSLEIIPSN